MDRGPERVRETRSPGSGPLAADPARLRPVTAGHQPCSPCACRVATTAAGGNGCGFHAGNRTPWAQGDHEHGHVSCSAAPETGHLATGLCGRAFGGGLADLYQVLPVATRSARCRRAGGHSGRGGDADVHIQAARQDVHAGLFGGGGHHEEALASQELGQGLPGAGGGLTPLGQCRLDQGVEEPDPSLRPPTPAGATSELHGPQQCQPKGRHYHGHPLQPGSAAAARLEVVRHVPPGEQVGNLG